MANGKIKLSGQDIDNMIMENRHILDACIDDLVHRGRAKAKAEHDYRVALAQEMLRQRNEKGIPVTILNDTARGKPAIAKLKLNRDIADTMFEVVQQKIYAVKKDTDVLIEYFKKEYQRPSNH